jgi:hypothetical protein
MASINVKSGYLAAAYVLLVVLLIPGVAMADVVTDLTPDKQNTIRQSCSTSQIILQQLQKRDAVLRINRGRAYDQLYRQISALNSRFSTNRAIVPELVSLADDMQSNLDRFRTDYDRYYDDLTNAIKSDCKSKPVDFYQLIVKARGDRTTVAADIGLIDELVSKYRLSLVHYQSALPVSAGANP